MRGRHHYTCTCEVGIIIRVAFLGDGEGNHLQTRVLENLYKTLPVAELIVGFQSFGDRGDDLLLDVAVRLKRDEQGEVVVRGISLIHDLEVECLCYDDTPVILARVERIVEDGCWEGTEDVSSAEVYPCGFFGRLLTHGLDVKLWELVALGLPLCGVELSAQYICQFHNYSDC